MATFPTLSKTANITAYIEEPLLDNTIRTTFSNGYVKTRGGTTVTPKKFSFTYSFLTETDKETLEDFQTNISNYGENSFTWVRPSDSSSFTVKLNSILNFTQEKKEGRWNVFIELVEQI